MGDSGMTAWEEGYVAFGVNPQRQACPYLSHSPEARAWLAGWAQAKADAKVRW